MSRVLTLDTRFTPTPFTPDTRLTRAIVTLIAALMLIIAAGPVQAHHGWSDYDAAKRATITGAITKLHFGNPHVSIVIEAEGKSWNVMLASPSRLQSRGCSKEMLAVGQSVTIDVLPNKTDPDDFRAERIILNGVAIELR